MNGTLRSPKKNLDRRESRKRLVDGAESAEANAESEGMMCLLEPLTLPKKAPVKIQLQDVNGKDITLYSENSKEDLIGQSEENFEKTQICSKEEEFQNRTVDFEKIEKYEEVCTTNVTNKIVHIEENVPNFQEQLVSACNKIRKRKSQDIDLPLNINGFVGNERDEINENGFSIIGVDDHTYTTAQTLRVRTVKEEDTIELQKTEQTSAHYTRNTDVYNRHYSSSENEQETAELFGDKDIDATLDDIENLNKDALNKPNKETEKILIRESEFGFTVEEKHYVSKLEKQRPDNLTFKPLTVELTMTKPQPFPVITSQPCRQDMRTGTLIKPLPITVMTIKDEVDAKICSTNEKKAAEEDRCSDILNRQYKSSCISECLCCLIQSFV